jgi:hypothetical protein
MSSTRRILRWIPTFLAFPLSGLVAILVVGSTSGALAALLAGAVVGTVLGLAQWLALRASGVGRGWWLATAVAVPVGTVVGTVLTASSTATPDLVVRGLITGLVVGAAQAAALRAPLLRAAGWALVTSAAWGLGWLITANVIVDTERGYVVFGASGAITATVLTGLCLPLVLRQRMQSGARDVSDEPVAAGAR